MRVSVYAASAMKTNKFLTANDLDGYYSSTGYQTLKLISFYGLVGCLSFAFKLGTWFVCEEESLAEVRTWNYAALLYCWFPALSPAPLRHRLLAQID
jgi:hypothetical protein